MSLTVCYLNSANHDIEPQVLALPSILVADHRSLCPSFTCLLVSFTALLIFQNNNMSLIRVPLGFLP
jgi:hypothetical protein